MQKLLPLAIFLALPAMASANNDKTCLISFAGAQQDVCATTATAVTDSLSSLLAADAVAGSSLRVVKFAGPITAAQRRAVEAAGARIISYAPYYAYVVRMPASLDGAVRQVDGVSWTGPLLPALKVDPNIYQELKGARIAEALGATRLTLTLDTDVDQGAAAVALSAVQGLSDVRLSRTGSKLRARATFDRSRLAETVTELAAHDAVISIGLRKPVRLKNSQGHWLHQSGTNSPEPVTSIWDEGIYGCGQTVAALDSGLWFDNVAFRDDVEPPTMSICNDGDGCTTPVAPNDAARKVSAYYKWSGQGNGSWYDYNQGHGTHVAGSITGNDYVTNPVDCDARGPIASTNDLDGMAPGAKLVMQEAGAGLEYLNDFGGGPYHAGDIAYQTGARVHSNSWGASCTDMFGFSCVSGCTMEYDELAADADEVMRDHDDLLVVIAAGNDGTICPAGNNIGTPGTAKNVLTIGATLRGAAADGMASFSSRGPTLDARTKPELGAQGNGIMSANTNPNGTRSESGTSMATPTASGLAVLVRDYLARGYYPSGLPTPSDAINDPSGALLKAILTSGAVEMGGSGAGANPGQAQGFGRILLDGSLHFDGGDNHLFFVDAENGLQTGGEDSYDLSVNAGSQLTVVLTWTDPPAVAAADPALVNELRLEVEAPNGDVWTQKLPANYTVNNVDPTQGTTTDHYDDRNNLHRIRFTAPQAGLYEFRVRGINVPEGPQKYALAATGDFIASQDPGFALGLGESSVGICAGEPASFDVSVTGRNGFVDPVQLSTVNLPAGTSAAFTPNPVTAADPAASSELTLTNTAGLSRGSYGFNIQGYAASATPDTRTIGATLNVSAGSTVVPALTAPLDGEDDVALQPSFSWADDPAADSYTIEVASDPGFGNIVASATVADNQWSSNVVLDVQTDYWWRVRANSACGDSAWSAASSFTTGQPFPEPYCAVNFSSSVEPITRVVLADIDNPSPVSSSDPHEDFTGVAGGDVENEASYDLRVEGTTAGNYKTYVSAYFDWDRDGSFSASEKVSIGMIENSTGSDGKHATAPIEVPDWVTPGPVRMRVLKKWSAEVADACNSGGSGYGQAEDYTLMVDGGIPTWSVGGNATGVAGQAVTLGLNGGETLVLTADGSFSFPTALEEGESYAVTIDEVRGIAECTLANASGVIAGADVDDVTLSCTIPGTPVDPDDLIFADGFDGDD